MQSRAQVLRPFLVAGFVLIALSRLAGPAVAEEEPTGIVLDYKPRHPATAEPAITIKNNGQVRPIRDHEIIRGGDHFIFADGLSRTAFVRVLVGANAWVDLTPSQPDLPSHSWPSLQALVPSLVAAYRWINTASSSEKPALRSALSRGDEVFSILPKVQVKLIISNRGTAPLWLGWRGGQPPFSVSATSGGKTLSQQSVCEQAAPPACVREALISAPAAGDDPLTIVVTSADGGSWSQTLTRRTIKPRAAAASADDLGNLGRLLEATELLDRGHGDYVLESARLLAEIAKDYPPARILLDRIRDGDVP